MFCSIVCLKVKEPVISSLSVFEGLDSNGGRSVEVDLYCTVCAVNKV